MESGSEPPGRAARSPRTSDTLRASEQSSSASPQLMTATPLDHEVPLLRSNGAEYTAAAAVRQCSVQTVHWLHEGSPRLVSYSTCHGTQRRGQLFLVPPAFAFVQILVVTVRVVVSVGKR